MRLINDSHDIVLMLFKYQCSNYCVRNDEQLQW